MGASRTSWKIVAVIAGILYIAAMFLPACVVSLLVQIILLCISYSAACVFMIKGADSLLIFQTDRQALANQQMLAWVVYYIVLAVTCIVYAVQAEHHIISFILAFIIGILLKSVFIYFAKQSVLSGNE